MLLAIWIFVALGLACWSLGAWALQAVLTLDPRWVDDVDALLRQLPLGELIERWLPGWQGLVRAVLEGVRALLGEVGGAAPLLAWLVWGLGVGLMLIAGAALSLIVVLLRRADPPRPQPSP